MHSHNVVEEAGFLLDLMNCAMPEYVVPSRTTFSRVVNLKPYKKKRKEVQKVFGGIFASRLKCLSLTMDSWTSHNSYVCITCHVMDTTFV